MEIYINQEHQTFHLQNNAISYIMMVLPDGSLGHLYYGTRLHEHPNWRHLLETCNRPMSSNPLASRPDFSLEHVLQEYPSSHVTDYREAAFHAINEDGGDAISFKYVGYRVEEGKVKIDGLPATYVEKSDEAKTLTIIVEDPLTHLKAELYYTIFADAPIMTRSVKFINEGKTTLHLRKVMSMCLDFPDHDFTWMQFSGSWARERHPYERSLEIGVTAIGSLRGHSSHQQNPFVILKRRETTESNGEAYAFSFVYSGNFLALAEVDNYETLRLTMGIHPEHFDWCLEPSQSFSTPEVVMAYTTKGLNDLSGSLHHLYRTRLVRGYWRDRVRPILLNSWEACYFDVTEDKVLAMAKKAKACGVELFVIDDGYFKNRHNDYAGLGDWEVDEEKFPHGFNYLTTRLKEMGLMTGLWIEPEMVNKESELYRTHPDYILQEQGRESAVGRHQYVLDFTRKEVVDTIYTKLEKLLSSGDFSYVKWDMNRSISEAHSLNLPASHQGEVFHRYILGVYDLYERLIQRFPHMLFESCASGGARFDAGMLYYAPQAWTSDDTDAIERLKIQYGTSYGYPLVSMGSHVSAVPNHQLMRTTPLKTRAHVAYFGTFGYELDPRELSVQDIAEMKKQTTFMKKYRKIIQMGTFYRLKSPFTSNEAAWMVVSDDQQEAIVGYYRILSEVNAPYRRVKLMGLNPDLQYRIDENEISYYGDELMSRGLITTDETSSGDGNSRGDYTSYLYILRAIK